MKLNYDKFVLKAGFIGVLGAVSILVAFVLQLVSIKAMDFVDIPVWISGVAIFFHWMQDENYKFKYYFFYTLSCSFIIKILIVIVSILTQNSFFIFLISLIRPFIIASLYEYFKNKSYKNQKIAATVVLPSKEKNQLNVEKIVESPKISTPITINSSPDIKNTNLESSNFSFKKKEDPEINQIKKDEIKSTEVKDEKIKKIIFFDTETNGLSPQNSVLSIAAIKAHVDLETYELSVVDQFKRYYFSKEPYDSRAIDINGLSSSKVQQLRSLHRAEYPKYFRDDLPNFHDFVGDSKHFVAHNINFDMKFINKHSSHQFCTMMSNTTIVKAISPKTGRIKWPKLMEAAKYYGIRVNESELHDSFYDVKLTIEVFKSMLIHPRGSKYVKDFLHNNSSYIREI